MIACTYVQLCHHFDGLLVWQDTWNLQSRVYGRNNVGEIYDLMDVPPSSFPQLLLDMCVLDIKGLGGLLMLS